MKTLCETKLKTSQIFLVLVAALPLLVGCSDKKPVFDDDKNYGQTPGLPGSADQPADDMILQPAGNSGDAVAVTPVKDDKKEETKEEKEEDDTDDGDDQQGPILGDDTDDDEEEPAGLDPDTLISSLWYRAEFNQDSAQGIEDGTGYKSLGQIESNVKEKLTTEETDGLVISQTFGDGVSTSLNTQEIYNSAGDNNRDPGTPSTSGIQYMDRLVSADCPGVLLCITRMIFEPVEGGIVSYCYVDPETGAQKPFPYGPMPNYKANQFESAFGTYGPFRVNKYDGVVECDAPGIDPMLSEDVVVNVYSSGVEDTALVLHNNEPLAVQHDVTFETTRVDDDLQSPYIDETVQLNVKSRYGMNEDLGIIIKMIVSVRQSIDVAEEAGGGLLGRIIANSVNIQGIITDLEFEMCDDLLKDDSPNHCM